MLPKPLQLMMMQCLFLVLKYMAENELLGWALLWLSLSWLMMYMVDRALLLWSVVVGAAIHWGIVTVPGVGVVVHGRVATAIHDRCQDPLCCEGLLSDLSLPRYVVSCMVVVAIGNQGNILLWVTHVVVGDDQEDTTWL